MAKVWLGKGTLFSCCHTQHVSRARQSMMCQADKTRVVSLKLANTSYKQTKTKTNKLDLRGIGPSNIPS
jgi:hypothetical protein